MRRRTPTAGVTTRKSLPQVLLAPVELALSPFMSHNKEPAPAGREPSARGRSGTGGLAALGGMIRSASQRHLGFGDTDRSGRGTDRSGRGRRGRSRSRSRSVRRGRTPSRFSESDSGGESGAPAGVLWDGLGVAWKGLSACTNGPSVLPLHSPAPQAVFPCPFADF